jgi:D-amino-acid dehydrogenase
VELQARLGGGAQRVFSAAQCLASAPALRLDASQLAGGVYSAEDEVGDCFAFCRELAARLRQRGNVTWHLGTHARGFVKTGDAVRSVDTSRGHIEADLMVLALGAEAPRFARKAGFHLPIWPMKGYSITATPLPGAPPLELSITDFDRKVVYAPLRSHGAQVVRVAGIADLVGFDCSVDPRRLATLMRHAADTLPLDLESDVRPWAGLRPVTPDSRPIIGWSPIRNLFLNTGHGALGWTLACGSARLAAELITDMAPSVRPEPFALARTQAGQGGRHRRRAVPRATGG